MLDLQWSVTTVDDAEANAHLIRMVRQDKRRTAPGVFDESGGSPVDAETLNIYLRQGGRLVGALLGSTYWGTFHVGWLWVDEQERGKGYGRDLLRRGFEVAKARGCTEAWWNTWKTLGSYRFFDSMGAQVRWEQPFPQVGQALMWYSIKL